MSRRKKEHGKKNMSKYNVLCCFSWISKLCLTFEAKNLTLCDSSKCMQRRYIKQLYYKWGNIKEREVRIPQYTWTSKVMTPVGCDDLCIYDVIPGATTKKLYRDTLIKL